MQNRKSLKSIIYLASSLKNRDLNQEVERILVDLGFRCFLPQRDVVQPEDHTDNETARIMRAANIAGLRDADTILVIARNIGNDTSWEVGFAKALGKRVVLLSSTDEMLQQHPMLWHSADVQLSTKSYSDTEEVIKRAREFFVRSVSDADLFLADLKNIPDFEKIEHKWKLFELRHSYAWNYFEFHAKQRMTVFNFFMVFAGLLVNAYVSVLKDLHNIYFAMGLAGVGAVLTLVFMFLDRRNEELVHIAEDVLESLESDLLFREYKREVKWPRRRTWLGWMGKRDPTTRQLGIFLRQKEDDKREDEGGCKRSRYSHGKWFPILQWIVIGIFVFLALFPVLPFYKPVNATDKPSNTVIMETGRAHEQN